MVAPVVGASPAMSVRLTGSVFPLPLASRTVLESNVEPMGVAVVAVNAVPILVAMQIVSALVYRVAIRIVRASNAEVTGVAVPVAVARRAKAVKVTGNASRLESACRTALEKTAVAMVAGAFVVSVSQA